MKTNSSFFLLNRLAFFLAILFILSIDVKTAFSQTGEVKVESKLRIVPSGDIQMGVFQPASSTGGGTGGGGTGGGGVTITPPPATGMYGWYRADEVYAETSGTPLSRVTVDGASVGSLKDASGNNRHMYQTADNRKPIIKLSETSVNSKPVLRFDGNLHAATNPGDTMSYRGDGLPLNYSIYFVVKKRSVDTGVTNRSLFCDVGTNNYLNFNYSAINKITHNSAALDVNNFTLDYSNVTYQIVSVSVNVSGTSYLTVGSQVKPSTATPSSTRGAGFDIGGGIYQIYSDMDVAEVIIYNAAQDPNSGDGLNVRKYLDQKYGLGLFTAPTAPPTANQYAWYSADESYSETSGTPTTKVTANNASVGSLKDRSGNSRNLYQATTTSQPKFLSSFLNSKPALLFDGADDFISKSSETFTFSGVTIYTVIKQDSWVSNGTIVRIQSVGDLVQRGVSPGLSVISAWVGGAANGSLTESQLVGALITSSSSSQMFVGASALSTAANHNGGMSISNGVLGLGNAGGGAYGGKVCEVLIYNSVHDPASGDGLIVRRYLDAKYNLGLGLNGTLIPRQNLYANYSAEESYKDAALTQLCSTSGTDTVYALKDLTGNGRALFQATADLRPTWFSNQRAAKPAVRFDGLNDYLKAIFNINQPTTVVTLVKQNTRVESRYLFDGATVNSGRVSQTANNFTLSQYAGSTNLDNPNATVGNYLLLFNVFNGANSKFKINNSTVIPGTTGTTGMGGFTLGSNGNGANNSNIDFVESAIYDAALDPETGDGKKVLEYFNDKYALNLFGASTPTDPTPPSTGLHARYDAAKAYKDLARTQLCSVSGTDNVFSLEDLSGNGRHLVDANNGGSINWISAQINGKPIFRCDGIRELKKNDFALSAPHVIYVVGKYKSGNGVIWSDSTDGTPRSHPHPVNFYAVAGTSTWMPLPPDFSNNMFALLTYKIATNGFIQWNTSQATTFSVSNLSANALTGFAVSADADFAEILIYQGEHTPDSGDGLLVRKYLNSKYNLGLTLP